MLRTILAISVVALASSLVAADRTTEAGEASIQDPNAECVPYGYPPITNALASFPPIWQPATIVQGDTAAMAKWSAIQPNVPNIPPKGTLQGNFSGVNYLPGDPDCWWTYSKCTTPKASGLPADIAAMPEPRTLGYGFDDGPNCSHNAFYDFLTSQNQKATMFYIGSNVMDWPLEAQRAVADGHEICAHTWSHRYMTAFQSQDAFAELYYSLQAIKLATGVTPTCWRPPYGDIDDRIRAIANGIGLRTVIWKYDSEDWQVGFTPNVTAATVDNNYQNMINDANNGLFANVGTIILTHELNNFTMSEAMKFYPLLKAAFLHLVPVGVGMNVSQPYLETNYTLPSFSQYISGITTLAANSTTNTATNTATTSTTNSQATQSATTSGSSLPASQTPTIVKKSGASALRLGWASSNTIIKVITAFLVGLAGAVSTGIFPS